jgi:hypothetical protein
MRAKLTAVLMALAVVAAALGGVATGAIGQAETSRAQISTASTSLTRATIQRPSENQSPWIRAADEGCCAASGCGTTCEICCPAGHAATCGNGVMNGTQCVHEPSCVCRSVSAESCSATIAVRAA